jgi:uncharacterized membrane protein YkgB
MMRGQYGAGYGLIYYDHMSLQDTDRSLIAFFQRISVPVARAGLFIVFFWFGLLKVLDLSPASTLVQSLFERTVPFMHFGTFMVLFGLFEILIGILFLIKGAERVVMPLLLLHLITTFMPLFLLPATTWSAPFVPTLEGQYIIKNVLLIAAAVGIAAHLHPLRKR